MSDSRTVILEALRRAVAGRRQELSSGSQACADQSETWQAGESQATETPASDILADEAQAKESQARKAPVNEARVGETWEDRASGVGERGEDVDIKINIFSSSSTLSSASSAISSLERTAPAPTPFQGSTADLLPLFEAAGVTARVCASPEDLARELAEVVRESGAKTAAAWDHQLLERLEAARLLSECGVAVIAPPEAVPEADTEEGREAASNASRGKVSHSPDDAATPGVCAGIEGADLGVCAAEALLAATGTVVLAPGPGRPRATALLPPVLLVLADPATAVANLRAFLPLAEDWRDRRDPSGLFCVTGPSATGDIEFVYVKGAHGPTRVVVLLAEY